jgi:hypothetical protein
MSRALDDRPSVGSHRTAHEERYPYNAVVANDRYLGRRPILHGIEDGDDTGGGEVRVLEHSTWFMEDQAAGQSHEFQMRRQAQVDICRERGEQTVLFGRADHE